MTFPERDTTKPATQQGLFNKFNVSRIDGSDAPGGKHFGCANFVIDMNHDPAAMAAMLAYAAACRSTHPQMAEDICARFGVKVEDLRYTVVAETGNKPFGYYVVESDDTPFSGEGFVKKLTQGVTYTEITPLFTGDMDYEEALAAHRDLVRQLDVALNGAGAAPQASLCDIVAQVEKEGIKALPADLKERRNVLMRAAQKAAYAYFVSCDIGRERIAASDINDNLRNAGRGVLMNTPTHTVVYNIVSPESPKFIGTGWEFFDDEGLAQKCYERHNAAGNCATLRGFHETYDRPHMGAVHQPWYQKPPFKKDST